MDSNKGHYDILGLDTRAPAGQIERAYRFVREVYNDPGLAAQLGLEPEALQQQRTRIDEAYRVLSDPEGRRAYDLELGLPEPAAAPLPPPRRADAPITRSRRRAKARISPRATPALPGAAIEVAVPVEPAVGAGSAAQSEPQAAVKPPLPAALPAAGGWHSPLVAAAAPTNGPIAAPAPPNGSVEPPEPPFDGKALRAYRIACGVSLEQIEAKTKVRKYYLENLEADRFDAFPAVLYLKGYLQAYCEVLGLDRHAVAASYLSRVDTEPPPLRFPTR